MSESVAAKFFAEVDQSRRGMGLFEHFNDLCYFAKDREGRFVALNDPTVLLLGKVSKEEILGKTDFELVPSYLAEVYLKDDEMVMEEGETISNKVELVTRNDLSVHWYSTTKTPLYGVNGDIIGLEGVTRPFAMASGVLGPYPELFRVIDFVETNYSKRITVADLAELAGLSLRTFERQFKKRFKISPSAYLKKVRINAACRELIHSNMTIAQIASSCGFCDQSYMTKEFARLMQVTPQVYRDTHVK
ncbi:MAG: AraC family transcriptional regulator [Verrucomicrobiota bacterium]